MCSSDLVAKAPATPAASGEAAKMDPSQMSVDDMLAAARAEKNAAAEPAIEEASTPEAEPAAAEPVDQEVAAEEPADAAEDEVEAGIRGCLGTIEGHEQCVIGVVDGWRTGG